VNEKDKSPGFPYIAENIFAPIYPVIAAISSKKAGSRKVYALTWDAV
jgi:hypothetical protein